jgi:hypothetical protein
VSNARPVAIQACAWRPLPLLGTPTTATTKQMKAMASNTARASRPRHEDYASAAPAE